MIYKFSFVLTLLCLMTLPVSAQTGVNKNLGVSKAYILKKVNKLRSKGCKCGDQRIKPVGTLIWNQTLELSAVKHAVEMDRYNFFAHHSRAGLDIGERIDALGYKWHYVGENLAEGQDSFDEALEDWLASESHCLMLMNKNMREMGVARVGKYWVHHFGKVMPPKTKRVSSTYYESR